MMHRPALPASARQPSIPPMQRARTTPSSSRTRMALSTSRRPSTGRTPNAVTPSQRPAVQRSRRSLLALRAASTPMSCAWASTTRRMLTTHGPPPSLQAPISSSGTQLTHPSRSTPSRIRAVPPRCSSGGNRSPPMSPSTSDASLATHMATSRPVRTTS